MTNILPSPTKFPVYNPSLPQATYAHGRMELQDFAESVLFARTLEEKPESGDADGRTAEPPSRPPEAPGRPDGLTFKRSGTAPAMSSLRITASTTTASAADSSTFCNHELLATELMALVLLRVHRRPTGISQGVAQTLRDEQEHTRMYLRRMRECGIEFGELPVSGYFWRMVSPMASPPRFRHQPEPHL